jgi:hypothetical protein
MYVQSFASLTLVGLLPWFCASDPAEHVVVREASVDGPTAAFRVEIDGQEHVVRRNQIDDAVIVTVADAHDVRLAAALERDGEVRYFDGELDATASIEDEAAATLVELAIDEQLSTDAPPMIELRRMMRDCEKEPALHPCNGDPWYLCGSC